MTEPLFLRLLDGVARVLALIAGASVILLSLLIVYDITARSFFSHSLEGTDELGGYTLALIGSLGLSYTLIRRGHPRIDLAFRFFPARMRAGLHVLALAAIAGFALFMTDHAIGDFRETLTFGTVTNTPLQTPLWVPQAIWVFGTGFFALTASVLTVHAALLFVHQPARVEKLYGPITVDEEVGEYIHADAPASGPKEA